MSFDWFDYLKLARTLAKDATSSDFAEASLRSAISRAYYSAYCASRNFASQRSEIKLTGGVNDHRVVQNHYINSSDRDYRRVGTWLARLRNNRNTADYDDTLEGDAGSLAQSSIALAENVFQALIEIPK